MGAPYNLSWLIMDVAGAFRSVALVRTLQFPAALEWAAVGIGEQQLESEDPESEDHKTIARGARKSSICVHCERKSQF